MTSGGEMDPLSMYEMTSGGETPSDESIQFSARQIWN